MKIGSWPRILPGTGVAHPVHLAAARIPGLHDGLAAMPISEAGHPQALQLALWEVRDVHIQDHRAFIEAVVEERLTKLGG